MASATVKSQVLVFGDNAVDWFLEREDTLPAPPDAQTNPRSPEMTGWRIHALDGGAELLSELVAEVCADMTVVSAKSLMTAAAFRTAAQHLVHGLARVEIANPKAQREDHRLRIAEPLYYATSAPGMGDGSGVVRPGADHLSAVAGPVAAVVLDDAGWGCRNETPATSSEVWPRALSDSTVCPLLIVKLSGQLRAAIESPLWQSLLRDTTRFERRIVVINCDDLRRDGLDIARRLSWDRTAQDLLAVAGRQGSLLWRLRTWGDVVVRLDLDGVLLIPMDINGPHWLVCDSASVEGDFAKGVARTLRHRHDSGTIGATASLVAALVGYFCASRVPDWREALTAALLACRHMYRAGLRRHGGSLMLAGRVEKRVDGADITPRCFDATAMVPGFADALVTDFDGLAMDFAMRGTVAISHLPHLAFGSLVTMAQTEVEQLRTLSDLFERHLAIENPGQPLCIAVFGKPGAGKSFGVKEIAKHVGPDDLEKHEINLAQISGPNELVREFHLARDTILRGKTPLIFFDEFDCSTSAGPLGWLAYFLAPMQDGEFRDQGSIHSLQRAIFVFAGSTAECLDEFKSKAKQPKFEDRKITDFVSRLQGVLEVSGPNQSATATDPLFRLRRAVLLRSLLLRLHPGLEGPNGRLRISEDVLRAFLFVDTYNHGARSIEALIRMSSLFKGSRTFETAMLPSDAQIALHADSESFRDRLRTATL